jgi:hypothetical protein
MALNNSHHNNSIFNLKTNEKMLEIEETISKIIKTEFSINNSSKNKINLKKYIEHYESGKKQLEKDQKESEAMQILIERMNLKQDEVSQIEEENANKKRIVKTKLGDLKAHMEKCDRQRSLSLARKQLNRIERDSMLREENEKLSASFEYSKRNLQEYERRDKELQMKQKHENAMKSIKVKEFSKIVNENLVNKADLKLKEEINKRIIELNSPTIVKKHKRTTKSVVLKEMKDKGKYNWDLKLGSIAQIENTEGSSNPLKKKKGVSSPIVVKKPLIVRPDYLTEKRIVKEYLNPNIYKVYNTHKWDKMLNHKNYPLIKNIEKVKNEMDVIDQKVKMKEQFLRNNGGVLSNAHLGEDISNLLVDSIKAKLAILNKINENKK